MHISDHVLRAFLALADTGQFTVAAEHCHMTQSARSQLVSKLEERLGVLLFHREPRSATLTAEGHRFLDTARRVTADFDQVVTELRDLATLQTGYVALAVVPSLAVTWLPRVLGFYRASHPGVRLQLHDVSSVRCLELVRQGVVDFALNSQPGTPHEVDAQLLFEEALYVVCPPGHPLAAQEVVTQRMLRGIPFLHLQGTGNMLVRTGGSTLRPARQVFQQAGVVDTGFDVNSLATLAGLVAAGLGVCMSPETALPQFSLLPTVAVRISPTMMTRPIYFIARMNRQLSPAASRMREILFEHPSALTLPPKNLPLAEWFNASKANRIDEDSAGALHAGVQAGGPASDDRRAGHHRGGQVAGRGGTDAVQRGQGSATRKAQRR